MDEYRQDEYTREQRSPRRNPGRTALSLMWRLAILLATIALMVGAVFLVVNRDRFNGDALRRYLIYHTATTGKEDATQFSFSGDTDSCFAVLDRGLLVCSETELTLLSKAGEPLIEQSIKFSQPVLDVSGDYAVAYDAGGTELYLIYSGDVVKSYTSATGQAILAARVNQQGRVTIVEQATGYKAAVTVYDSTMTPQMTENISSAFVTDAILSPEGDTLALVTIGEDSEGFHTAVVFYQVSDGSERFRCALGNTVLLDLKWSDNDTLWAGGEYGAYVMSGGSVQYSYTDTGGYLRAFSLGGDGFATLYFTKHQSGIGGSLVLLNSDGTECSIGISDELQSVSAAGNYIAVLTSTQVTIYTSDLSVYATAANDSGARRVLMREDGSAMVISAGSAWLFVPE